MVVGFLDGDPRFPVVLGQCHSSAKPAPEPAKDDNHLKGYVSRSKMKLTFDDDKKVVVLETPAGNKLTLSEDDKTASLADQNGNKITLDDSGITIESAKDMILKAAGDVKLEGTNVECKAQASFKAEGQCRQSTSSRQRDPDRSRARWSRSTEEEDVFPAARVTDQIVSTATQGAPVPIIPPGAPTVLIGGMPAAALGDTLRCRTRSSRARPRC